MNSQRTGRLSLVPGSGGAAPERGGLGALLAAAEHEVVVMSTGRGSDQIGAFRRIDHANLGRGVRYRVLFPDTARLSGALSAIALSGAQVRTDEHVPMDAVVIDGHTVVLPAEGTTGSRAGVAVFRLPGVLAATAGLFERVWSDAVPLAPVDPDGERDGAVLSERERHLLGLLCSGHTDESAAARLGISVRTVRRTVAEIMNRLGARSRFQAGAKAVGRGWVMDRAG